MHIIADKNMVE